ncbi:N-acetylmuramidase domain-containing protein [Aureimonas populi]|uniref:N-acetylmuramidase domain-containing protein n=1 Tax=Aureimonas populi TaxID=1701758 RepID=A0ABW5CGP3_9HYPH|nr:N-acetylmuramidase domain-containing protein [Aureimonas populi]
MAVSKDVIEAALGTQDSEGVAASVLLAVALVETNAMAFAPVGGRSEPLIRFEGHYFDRLLPEAPRRIARAAGLASPRAGTVRNPAGQPARWAMLERAASIDAAAAYRATSWGLGQVMGEHWKRLGFASVHAMADLARQSAKGQFILVARFLKEGALHRLLLSGDHKGFARRYNGPGFAANRYDAKIAEAHAKARRLLARPVEGLRLGARGPAVAALQKALVRHGHPLAPDGIFGPRTQGAVMAFQKAGGLAPSGMADRATLDRLGVSG